MTHAGSRNEAFATVRLADSLGLGLGVVLGGALIASTGAYRALFAIDGLTFLLFFAIVAVAISETLQVHPSRHQFWQGWGQALGDRTLLIYVSVNILFTVYLSQIQSTLPVYLNHYVSLGATGQGLSEATLSALFTWYVALSALCQLPVARYLNRFSQPQALMVSALLWALGFGWVWVGSRFLPGLPILLLALSTLALATVAYTPVASSLVVRLAPEPLRGVYLSVNSMCWAMGYLIGPPLGGWALDQSFAHGFWLGLAASAGPGIAILAVLQRRL
jgi:MFS family permease